MESDVRPSERPCRMEDAGITSASDHQTEITSSNESANYDVFISHRGPDTKAGFVSHLCKDLEAAGLQPFLDCRSIDMGEHSWERIENAIKKTPIAVVVFSESFAASEWCLRELDVMLGTPGVKVLPVFYNVRPSEVRILGSGQLRVGFEKLSRRHDETVMERWRGRLEEASKIMGWEHPGVYKLEAELVSAVVREIVALANKPLPLAVGGNVIGVKQVAEEMMGILEKKEVLMLGLWGMGGIGKSTLARELYNQLSGRYDVACYVEDVTQKVTQGGVVKVQQQMMADLCKNNPEDIKDKSKGKSILEERICKKRFLLVLDDVRDNDEMEYWISSKMLIGGSKCIITSRNRRVFETSTSLDVDHEVHVHDVQGLSSLDSERVFVSYAFGAHGRMKAGFEELVSSISKGCGGVPLVLKVCGSLLKGMEDVDVWKEVLTKLNDGTIMDQRKIFECLQISYDALSVEEQEMFLDIACALVGERKDLAVGVWKGSPNLGMYSLMKRALITVDEKGCLRMHDHLRDMGREIERKRRASDGVIRRLWMPESLTLLCKNKGLPDSVHSLVLSCNVEDTYGTEGCMIRLDVSHMKNLRILMCTGALKIVSSILPSSVYWVRYLKVPSRSRSISWFWHPNEIKLWIVGGKSELGVLEFSCLEFHRLSRLNRELSNLEVLDLNGCPNLTMLSDSIGGLKKLRELNLRQSRIESLPRSFGELSNLERLDLYGCWYLTMLPDSFGGLKKLRELKISYSGIKSLPRSFGELSYLEVLHLNECRELTMLPDSFGGLKKLRELNLEQIYIEALPRSFGELSNLEVLDLSWCSKLTMIPDSFGGLKKLGELNLGWSKIESLPRSFGELSNLEVLDLQCCGYLFMLPDSFGGLKELRKLKLSHSEIESLPRSFGELSNLEVLDLSGCNKLTMLPDSFGGLKKLRELYLRWSGIESLRRSFGELSNLEGLDLESCSKLTMLPDSFGGLKKLRELNLRQLEIESLPKSFGELSILEVMDSSLCRKLTMLPDSFGGLKKLRELKLFCSGIESLPRSFGELSNLEVLDLSGCSKLTMLPDSFGGLKKLQKLELSNLGIESLPQSFGKLSNLEVLGLSGCSKLTMLLDSFGGLKKLQDLKLSKSEIESFPRSFGELNNLEVLNLNECSKPTILSDLFEGLKKLWELNPGWSGIESLPRSFG